MGDWPSALQVCFIPLESSQQSTGHRVPPKEDFSRSPGSRKALGAKWERGMEVSVSTTTLTGCVSTQVFPLGESVRNLGDLGLLLRSAAFSWGETGGLEGR